MNLADRRVLDVFLNTDTALPEAEKLFSHVLNAQHIWIMRIKGEKPLFDTWTLQDKAFFMQLHRENTAGLSAICIEGNLEREIDYRNSKGELFVNRISDVLLHVANHSTYHRAQIAHQFRLNAIEPPVTDYIILKREKEF